MTSQYLTLANALTIFRLVLFGAFIFFLLDQDIIVATSFFLLAWAFDAVDGFVARSFKQATHIGSMLDKATDRLIIIFGVLFFIKGGYLPSQAILLLSKDIALLPALTIYATSGHNSKYAAGAGWLGKLTTVLQGAGIFWLLAGLPFSSLVIGFTAALGAFVGWHHLRNISLS